MTGTPLDLRPGQRRWQEAVPAEGNRRAAGLVSTSVEFNRRWQPAARPAVRGRRHGSRRPYVGLRRTAETGRDRAHITPLAAEAVAAPAVTAAIASARLLRTLRQRQRVPSARRPL